MIVVLDTSALHGDVFAERAWAAALFDAAAAREDLDVWVPSVVVEELVRQFPERLEALITILKKERHQASAFGWKLPAIPDFEKEVLRYRDRLAQRLRNAGVEIALPPSRTGHIAEWVAQQRMPIPGDGDGIVDAQVWLTAVQAAEQDRVTLITDNHLDFCDPGDRTRLHPVLRDEMDGWGISPDKIRVAARIIDFNREHIAPSAKATEQAREILGSVTQKRDLVTEIERAALWFPAEPEDGWEIGFDLEEATFGGFEVGSLMLVRADPNTKGVALTIETYGTASIDFYVTRDLALKLIERGSNLIDTWDIEDTIVPGQFETQSALLIEVLVEEDQFSVSVDAIREIREEDILALLRTWIDRDHEDALAVVAESFDGPNEREAIAIGPQKVEKFRFENESVYVRVEFSVDYANPIDGEDQEMSAENVTEHVIDLRIEAPDLIRNEYSTISETPFPY